MMTGMCLNLGREESAHLLEVSIPGPEEGHRVLLRHGDGHRGEEGVGVGDGRRAVDRHDPADLESHLAKVVNVPRRLF